MNITNPDKTEYLKSLKASHSAAYVSYHIVWGTHYRRRILDGHCESVFKMIEKICDEKGYTILNLAILTDHIHLLLKAKPTDPLSDIVKFIKGKSSYMLHDIMKGHSGNGFWAKGYYAETVGNRTVAQIKSYIDKQKEHHSVEEGMG